MGVSGEEERGSQRPAGSSLGEVSRGDNFVLERRNGVDRVRCHRSARRGRFGDSRSAIRGIRSHDGPFGSEIIALLPLAGRSIGFLFLLFSRSFHQLLCLFPLDPFTLLAQTSLLDKLNTSLIIPPKTLDLDLAFERLSVGLLQTVQGSLELR